MRAVSAFLSLAMVAVGVAMIVVGIDREDWLRAVLGVLFIAAGAGRLLLLRRGT